MNDQEISHLRQQLSELVQKAGELKEAEASLADELKKIMLTFKLRIRPSVGGYNVLSCNSNMPQMGVPPFSSLTKLEAAIRAFPAGKVAGPKRPTPEKALQSFILRSAMDQSGQLHLMQGGGTAKYWLVSDEIALFKGEEKTVGDILAVKVEDGLAELVSIELKSDRHKSTFAQVANFRALMEPEILRPLWKALAEKMTGKRFKWREPWVTSGIVVWPIARSGQASAETAKHIAAQTKIGVTTISYQEYVFSPEAGAERQKSPDGP